MPFKDINRKREYDRLNYHKKRDEFFKDKSCVKCGSIENLELDHIDPKLKVSHRIWTWTESKRLVEISKCQILCHKCHLNKTLLSVRKTVTHGTRSGWEHYKCRCELCHQALLIDSKRRKLNK